MLLFIEINSLQILEKNLNLKDKSISIHNQVPSPHQSTALYHFEQNQHDAVKIDINNNREIQDFINKAQAQCAT